MKMIRYLKRVLPIVLVFTIFFVPLRGYASGQTGSQAKVDAAKAQLSAYESWFGPDTDDIVLRCPGKGLKEEEVLYYMYDVYRTLKGTVGMDSVSVEFLFPFSLADYQNDPDVFSEAMFELQEKLCYLWPQYSGINSLTATYIGSDPEAYFKVRLYLNGQADAGYYSRLREIVEAGRARAGNDQTELAEYFVQWVEEHIVYDEGCASWSVPAVLSEGHGACEGFSGLFYDLCTAAGIPALQLASMDLSHAWNAAFLNGTWYTMDMLGVVCPKSESGKTFFTDPDHTTDDPVFQKEIENLLLNPVPVLTSNPMIEIEKKSGISLRKYIRGLAANPEIRYASSDDSVVRVDAGGQATPVSRGTVTVEISVTQNGKIYTLKQKVKNAVKDTTDKKKTPAKGKELTWQKNVYKVTKAAASKGGSAARGTVEYVKPSGSAQKAVTIPAAIKVNGISYNVTSVGANAFKNNKTLRSVVIGNQVTQIKKNAFSNCPKLTKVTLGTGVKKIAANAFANDRRLKNLKIRSSKITSIAAGAFKGAPKKIKVSVPKTRLAAYRRYLKKAGIPAAAKIRGVK